MGNINSERLVFVYNANSGIGNALLDGLHKTFSPATYSCNLCALTFGIFSENKKWKEFRQDAGLEMEFLHLDEFKKRFPGEQQKREAFPQVFISTEGQLTGFLSKGEINDMKNQEDLIAAVQAKYEQNNVLGNRRWS
jgi:hypothetical protein